MTTIAAPMIDPLGVFMARLHERKDAQPIPLMSTSFDIAATAGLVTVTTTRLFRNVEAMAIEAIMTFPVPVHAALFALEARIDGRVMHASAQKREAARETYEDAIQRGKAAVLHEEVLRGIHMLSVANLRPGGDVEIVTRWAAALAFVEGRGQLRIPLTAGQVYGWSGLSDSDELTTESRAGQRARIDIRNSDGPVTVAGATLIEGRGEVPLDRPIDIEVPVWRAAALAGRAADGRRVELTVTPATTGATRAAIAVLLDVSGSMGERFTSASATMTNHEAAKMVLRTLAGDLGDGDTIDLWQFNTAVTRVGLLSYFDGRSVDTLLDGVASPGGGTETGRAVETVAAHSDTRDLLLITDGKSHALDVQRLAALGRRVSVLLIGEDSLEANVGHLAALTGGELFIARETILTSVAKAMIAAIRAPYAPVAPIADRPEALTARRGGVTIAARWTDAAAPTEPTAGVSAVAAALAMTGMGSARAAALAEAEGLVTHLTSLVLVDEAGSIQEGIPAMRKVALEMPAVAAAGGAMLRSAPAYAASPSDATQEVYPMAPPGPMPGSSQKSISHNRSKRRVETVRYKRLRLGESPVAAPSPTTPQVQPGPASGRSGESGGLLSRALRRISVAAAPRQPARPAPEAPSGQETAKLPGLDLSLLRRTAQEIDWSRNAPQLIQGDVSGLSGHARDMVIAIAATLRSRADALGIDPHLLAVALAARIAGDSDRSAMRVARMLLDRLPSDAVAGLLREIGI